MSVLLQLAAFAVLLSALACASPPSTSPSQAAVPPAEQSPLAAAPPTLSAPPAPTLPSPAPPPTFTPVPAAPIPLPAVQTVQSSDGSAKLEIPAGALPAGVAAGDIRMTDVTVELRARATRGQPPLAAYKLEPDGLEFSSPVTITIVSNIKSLATGGAVPVPLLSNLRRMEVEPVRALRITIDLNSGRLEASGAISHFSTIVLEDGLWRMSLDEPTDHYVGETFAVRANVAKTGAVLVSETFTAESVSFYGQGGPYHRESQISDGSPQASSVSTGQWALHGLFWAREPDRSTPATTIVTPNKIVDAPLEKWFPASVESHGVEQSFTCIRAGPYRISYFASVGYWRMNVRVWEGAREGQRDRLINDPVDTFSQELRVTARCLEAPAVDAPPASPTPTSVPSPTPVSTATRTATPSPTATPAPTATPVPAQPTVTLTPAAACTLGLAMTLDDIVIVPGQYHEGVIRIRAFDRSGSRPLASVRIELEARKSDGQVTQGTVTTNEQGEATARMRTTDYGQNTLLIRQATSSSCPWPFGDPLPEFRWDARP